MTHRIYMDHAATTPLDERVAEAMKKYGTESFGNPSTLYSLGLEASKAVEDARAKVAEALGAKPNEIYFTSGGTESDNWALKGVAFGTKKGNHIITDKIEHHAVLEPCEFLEKHAGFEMTYLDVDKDGMVNPEDVKNAITDKTILVSIMHANNEIGTIEPIEEIGAICKEKGVYFHTDAVQTVGKLPIDVNRLNVDMLSLSAHKFYGPKGVGALYIRKGTRVEPFMHGGGQEQGRRASTHNVPGIVGLGEAIRFRMEEMEEEEKRLEVLGTKLRDGLLAQIEGTTFNGHRTKRLPGNVNICIEAVEGESMLMRLDMEYNVCVSSGSACTTGSLEPSHVLLAIGLSPILAHGSLRFTLGRSNTEEEVDYVIEYLPSVIEGLRRMSPFAK